MGTRGPIPKRSEQRRRTNEPELPIDRAPGAENVEQPEPGDDWHPIARQLFEALGESGQSRFYEPSDWAAAVLLCESISRDLSPQVVGTTETGEILRDVIPLKGASLSAYLKAFAALGVTEGDRRRLSIELQRGEPGADPDAERAGATVTRLRALTGG